MSEHPMLFGFGIDANKFSDDPMEYPEHYLVGANPDDENGCWDTKEEALINFAKQFEEIASIANHKFLFVRRAPGLFQDKQFGDNIKYKMIGRFSLARLKEKTNEGN
jgi:hypothetical protein